MTRSKIILKMPKAEIPNRNFSLRTNPLALFRRIYIFHKNREISILTIKKKTARLTLPQEATERTKKGETQNKTKHEKHTAV